MAVTVHFVMMAEATLLVLDVVELPRSHSGDNMSTVIEEIVNIYGMQDKVS
jgi:hypothetical protein